MRIKTYQKFNEEVKFKNWMVAALLSLGLTQADAQYIDTPKKEVLIDTLYRYNQNPKGLKNLEYQLSKHFESPKDILKDLIEIRPDHTVVVRPNFIPGLELITNPENKFISAGYKLKF